MAKRKSNLSLSDVLLELGFDEDGNAVEKESFSLGKYFNRGDYQNRRKMVSWICYE